MYRCTVDTLTPKAAARLTCVSPALYLVIMSLICSSVSRVRRPRSCNLCVLTMTFVISSILLLIDAYGTILTRHNTFVKRQMNYFDVFYEEHF